MITRDHLDAELRMQVTCSTSASTPVTSDVIDISEIGGSEHAQFLGIVPSADQVLTCTVESSDKPDGTFTKSVIFHTEAGKAYENRERIPLYTGRYLRLKVETGETAPSTAVPVTVCVTR